MRRLRSCPGECCCRFEETYFGLMSSIRRYITASSLADFKKEGRLSLSNIWRFQQLEEPFLDKNEGTRRFWSNDGDYTYMGGEELDRFFEDSNSFIKAWSLSGVGRINLSVSHPNAIALCAAAGDHLLLKDRFNLDTYFTIVDVKKFGDAVLIALQNLGFTVIMYSYDWVDYVESKNFRDTRSDFEKTENLYFPPGPTRIINTRVFPITRYFGSYFTKEVDPFIVEKEYRFVYLCEENIEADQRISVNLDQRTLKECVSFD